MSAPITEASADISPEAVEQLVDRLCFDRTIPVTPAVATLRKLREQLTLAQAWVGGYARMEAERDELRSALTACEKQRDEAIGMLADWVARVAVVGTGWDDWDEGYKDAAYRPCGIRELIDSAVTEARKAYERS